MSTAAAPDRSVRAFPVAAVIVGAGAGRRFGGPKAIATLSDGRRFLDAVSETAMHAGLDPIVAVLPPGVAAFPSVRVVVNPDPESEQIVSVRFGLAQLTSAPVIAAMIWPVDHPLVELESVLAVLDGARRTNAPIAVPVHEGRRGHPTFFHRDVWRELMTVADGGARAVLRTGRERVCEVEVPDRGVIRGINTREDLD
ncbi:MAG TPA: NTP transferase domain-containing protein [Gemmatimonadaceae bacterium]|nr:NTP transferase domain-containing protein [Gemmatimonadaceae bacterium]